MRMLEEERSARPRALPELDAAWWRSEASDAALWKHALD